MGKVILPLSEGELSEKTIFDRRFVIECCETFHLHWRNLRLELSADNWIQLVEAFETGIAKWRAHGSPLSHPHLELARFLMDTSQVIHPTTANAELCENLYKTLRETHGADAEFWVEDAFVHFHYRDLRVEMPIADFLQFSKTMTAAHTKLRSHTYRPLEDLFRQLDEENIIYVVLRNWEALPESVAVGPHSDLDLLVHPLHVEKVDKLWRGERTHAEDFRVQRKVPVLGPAGEQSYILVDVRSTDDGYMPEDWCHRLLSRRVPHKMFHVLPPRDYFVSLLYHAVAHKGVMSADYAQRLLALAAEAGIDTDLSRIGDFREACRMFAEEGVEISKPRDGSVLPKMPYFDPPASVVSSRILDVVDGRPFVSRVAFVQKDGRPIVRKQTTFELAEREHALLSLLHSERFPKPIATWRDGIASVCEMELVDGYPLSDLERFVAETSPEGARTFLLACVEILAELRARSITHRDIRTDNILVRDGQPVLIDFGWAVSPEHPYITPAGLGDAGRAPEGFCDTYAMGVALTPAFAHYPELLHVLATMTRPSAAERVTDPAALRELVDAGSPAPAEVAAAVCRIAEQAIGSGALEPAQAALERALVIAPDDAALLAAAGTVRLALGDAAAAETLLERALEIEPESLTARTGLAHAALDQGRVDEARQRYAALPGEARAATIVIPVYNRVDLTRQCLATLRSSTPSHLYEVVVVDNGSTDETAAFLRRARAAGVLRAVFPGENLGFGKACNLGASLARGSSIVLLNNDTIPGEGWLEALLEVAEDKTVGIVGSRLLYPDGRLQHAGIALNADGLPFHIHRHEPAEFGPALVQRDYPAVTGASMLLRREVYEQLGGFDEMFQMYVEDVDLCLRAWGAGLRVVYCPKSLLVHLESASVTDLARRDEQVRTGWGLLRSRWDGKFATPPWGGQEPERPQITLDGVRSFAALAFADELVAHPEILRTYTDTFGDRDDASLVIYAPGRQPAEIAGALGQAMRQAGIQEAGCPDLLVVAADGGREGEAALVGAVDAAYTRRNRDGAFAALDHFDDGRVADLRLLAERRWGRLAA
jgi:GT2 family glycosyltransferase